MTQAEIEGFLRILTDKTIKAFHDAQEEPPKNAAEKAKGDARAAEGEVMIRAGMELIGSLLIDTNRIASALEIIAYNSAPKS